MNNCLIYGLFDKFGNVRYIGMSTSGLIRPKKHLNPSSYRNSSKSHYHIYSWIRKSLREGFEPKIKVIDIGTKSNIYKLEQKWIKYFKKKGMKLTNKVDGGPGMLGLKHSNESKMKMSKAQKGKKISDKILEMFRNQKGKNHPMYGRKHNKEAIIKMRNSHLGYIMPKEQKDKISQALKGKKHGPMSPNHRQKLINAQRHKMKPIRCIETGQEFESIRQASREMNLSRRSIGRIIKNEQKQIKGFSFKSILGL